MLTDTTFQPQILGRRVVKSMMSIICETFWDIVTIRTRSSTQTSSWFTGGAKGADEAK